MELILNLILIVSSNNTNPSHCCSSGRRRSSGGSSRASSSSNSKYRGRSLIKTQAQLDKERYEQQQNYQTLQKTLRKN